jgi:hypothetical protein
MNHRAMATALILSLTPALATDVDAKSPLVELRTACERLLTGDPTNYTTDFDAGLDVYAVIPKTEAEYHNVFGKAKTYTQAASVDMFAAATAVAKQGTWKVADAATVKAAKMTAAQHLQYYIKSSKKSLVGVIGHNEDGLFKFADGSSMSIKDIAEACFSLKKKCVIISCNSEKYIAQAPQAAQVVGGTSERPLFAHVPSLVDGLNKFVLDKAAKKEKVSYEKIEVALLSVMKEKRVDPGLMQAVMPEPSGGAKAIGVATAAGAGAVVIAALTFGNQDEEEKRKQKQIKKSIAGAWDALGALENETKSVSPSKPSSTTCPAKE